MKKVYLLLVLSLVFIVSFNFISAVPACTIDVTSSQKDIICNVSCNERIETFVQVIDENSIVLESRFFEAKIGELNFSKMITGDNSPLKFQCKFLSEGKNFSSDWIYPDVDGDGYITRERLNAKLGYNPEKNGTFWDVDDWTYDDLNSDWTSDTPFSCFKNGTKEDCTIDSDNNGVNDYSECAACRYPALKQCIDANKCLFAREECDNVDNDGFGHCQGNLSKVCFVPNFDTRVLGDGVISNASGNFSCAGVKNQYGVLDEFCQMVDDNVDVCNGLYSRCVKYMVFDAGFNTSIASTLPSKVSSDSNILTKSFTRYAFVPGGVLYNVLDYDNLNLQKKLTMEGATCGIQQWQYLFSSNENLNFDNGPVFSNGFYDLAMTPYGGSYKQGINYLNCLSLQENFGGSRRTNFGFGYGLESNQFIDSFRGELNFNTFWAEVKKTINIREKFSNNNSFKYSWEMACVSKDKCADGVYQERNITRGSIDFKGYGNSIIKFPYSYVENYNQFPNNITYVGGDNNGAVNLFDSIPYNYFVHPFSINYLGLDDKFKTLGNFSKQFLFKLADADDPYCKFKDPASIVYSYGYGAPNYTLADYKINLYTQKPYCSDQDGDGFCGCSSLDSTPGNPLSTFCNFSKKENSYYLASMSNTKFPDCGDSTLADSGLYLINGTRFMPSDNFGWSLKNQKSLFGAWNVHPLSPVTQTTCTLGFDVDCNKNFVDNPAGMLAMSNPYSSYNDTPFDWNLSSGREISVLIPSSNSNIDLKCITLNAYNQLYNVMRLKTSDITSGVISGIRITAISPLSARGFSIYAISNQAVDLAKCSAFFAFPDKFDNWKNVNSLGYKCANLSSDLLLVRYGLFDSAFNNYDFSQFQFKLNSSIGRIKPLAKGVADINFGPIPSIPPNFKSSLNLTYEEKL